MVPSRRRVDGKPNLRDRALRDCSPTHGAGATRPSPHRRRTWIPGALCRLVFRWTAAAQRRRTVYRRRQHLDQCCAARLSSGRARLGGAWGFLARIRYGTPHRIRAHRRVSPPALRVPQNIYEFEPFLGSSVGWHDTRNVVRRPHRNPTNRRTGSSELTAQNCSTHVHSEQQVVLASASLSPNFGRSCSVGYFSRGLRTAGRSWTVAPFPDVPSEPVKPDETLRRRI